MEGKSRRPEITVVPAAGGGAAAAVDAVKAANKEPISPGSPSLASGAGKESLSRHEAAVVSLPAWKLDALCQESGSSPAVMRARFPYF
ncbi:unknown protein [Oryza sativa Japonica Group]|jgi:hypothetical protein|uniref:Os01g0222600 protein n=5 Tax=Oryza TaxID=4527 RepID=Q0JPH6_ORYSJ|nr:uncharacterized protein LOC4326700 [Oryza sativa Japonica Group]EAY73071.1 hypothetical protein OsI_00946 [Oryza sativa Indica Group]KAB8080555.1 hypothetical protein EE612_001134 [Oryza sativa]EAZ11079.1 hypothetical protein OsJ_00924 [Oryza sativa Japonica Group]BAA94531.1 unknown protein [Oryza sativa Japonica Group]BAF04352.1 Os01g0222600 [Oryza sativa Japonica Group]|eukprot:NP_001042438.1 Os01g0222600 [Oryza sativa Japonica Group]